MSKKPRLKPTGDHTKRSKAKAGKAKPPASSRTTTSTKKPKNSKPAKATTKAKTPNAKKGTDDKRLSALDAAAQVLAKTDKPMRAKELIKAMSEQGLWSSPKGKTPHATLFSAINREIASKGKESRFKKVDRGEFAFNG